MKKRKIKTEKDLVRYGINPLIWYMHPLNARGI